jgi:hypothetical protein
MNQGPKHRCYISLKALTIVRRRAAATIWMLSHSGSGYLESIAMVIDGHTLPVMPKYRVSLNLLNLIESSVIA